MKLVKLFKQNKLRLILLTRYQPFLFSGIRFVGGFGECACMEDRLRLRKLSLGDGRAADVGKLDRLELGDGEGSSFHCSL